MSKSMYELRDMLEDELNKISKKGEMTMSSLDTIDKLTHSIKSIDTICAMEEAGEYSHDGMSYARGRYSRTYNDDMNTSGNYSGRRYSRRDGRYSYGSDKDRIIDEMRGLMEETSDSRSRMAIQKCIDTMEG